MITFNGVAYELTSLDNMQTIKLYIAAQMRTTTYYLFFPNGVPDGDLLTMETDVAVVDLSRFIINLDTLSVDEMLSAYVCESITLQMVINGDFPSTDRDSAERWSDGLELRKDVLVPFISTNRVLTRLAHATDPEYEEGDEEVDSRDYDQGLVGPLLLQISDSIEESLIGSLRDEDEEEEDELQIDVTNLWSDRISWKRRFKDLLSHTSVEANSIKERYREFGRIEPDSATTEFIQEKLNLNVSFKTEGISLMEIVNAAVLSREMPFISCDSKYKILMGMIPPPNWAKTDSDILLLRVAAPGSQLEGEGEIDSYLEFKMGLSGPFHNQKLLVRTDIHTFDKAHANMDFANWLIEHIRALLPTFTLSDPVADTDKISGIFYFPDQDFNIDIFSDLILTESVFPTLLNRNDSKTVSRKKDSVYLYFNDIQSGIITARFTPQLVVDNDPMWNIYSQAQFPTGTRYIRVKIQQAQNKAGIDRYMDFMRRTMSYYNQHADALFTIYREFIGPDFGVISVEEEKPVQEDDEGDNKKMLKKIVPDLFVNHYGSACDSQPIVVKNDQAASMREQGIDVMTFPKPGAPGTPHHYACTPNKQGKTRYPGIRPNPLPNKEKYPFIPCCYLKPGERVPYYGHYFRGDPPTLTRKTKSKQQNVYTSSKFGQGYLPDQLLAMIKTCDTNPDSVYNRVGNNGSPSNFLVEVAEAMYHTFDRKAVCTSARFERYSESLSNTIQGILHAYGDITDHIDENRATDAAGIEQVRRRRSAREEDWIRNTRIELCSEEFYAVARQSIYDWSYEKYSEYMRDVNKYLDPELFTAVIELVFGCNIYVFYNRDKVTELRLPRHTQNYMMNFPSHPGVPTVIMYNHWGANADRALFPRSEIIIYTLESQKNYRKWVFGIRESSTGERIVDPLYRCVTEIAKKIQASWSLNRRDHGGINFELMEPNVSRPLSQVIDPYGKCRRVDMRVLVHSLETDFTLLCQPNKPQPFVTVPNDTPVLKVDMGTALSIADVLRLRVIGQSLNTDGNAVAIVLQPTPGRYTQFRTKMRIPIHPSSPLEDIRHMGTDELENDHIDEQSEMQQYNHNKRLARYIQDYALFLYSKYLDEERDAPSLLNLTRFINDKTSTIQDFNYGRIGKSYSADNGLFNAGKLVFASDEMKRRIVYYIRLFTTNNYKNLMSYHLRSNIESYYVDLSDLDQMVDCTLIEGIDTFLKWIQVQKSSVYTIVKNVKPEADDPYFMISEEINLGKPFMVQNTNIQDIGGLDQAISISLAWVTEKRNIGPDADIEIQGNCAARVYLAGNDGSVKLIGIVERDPNADIIVPVLAWEQSGHVRYAAIMFL